jgi:hypothetical protein
LERIDDGGSLAAPSSNIDRLSQLVCVTHPSRDDRRLNDRNGISYITSASIVK